MSPDSSFVAVEASTVNYLPDANAIDPAVSWPAIIAGAFVTAALGLSLLALGAGAGLSSLSPWGGEGVAPRAVGTGALVWLAIVEVLACALGGYLAGRLRTKWINVHPHEKHFRDTAHGFLVWAVALVITAAFLTSAAAAMVGHVPPRTSDPVDTPSRYYVDMLFRMPARPIAVDSAVVPPMTMPATPDMRDQAAAILMRGIRERALAADDQAYLARMVTLTTGLPSGEAQQRVNQTFGADQQAVDAARKATAHGLYWLFVALLLGAFSASWLATIGGRHREFLHVD